MIQLLSTKYHKSVAYLLLIIFECSFLSVHANPRKKYYTGYNLFNKTRNLPTAKFLSGDKSAIKKSANKFFKKPAGIPDSSNKGSIGGPSQPEMSSFKSVGTDNMVNLFTGDFSYNIPLLDVGGYPVNIFYDGSITPEQEASWVGLGWNINPGTVNRNMRGVPDDFDGSDELKQTQVMKPNVTWGFTAGADLELIGIKESVFANFSGSVGASLDLSFNNYLGPALGLGVKGTTNIKIANIGSSEKGGSVGIGGGISANINSRSGLTLSPSLSLTANAFRNTENTTAGIGLRLGTSYNSRSGIKALQLSEQVGFNHSKEEVKGMDYTYTGTDASIGMTASSTISFSKPTYIPALRMPLTNEAYSGHFQLGGGLFGVYGSAEIEAYKQVSRVAQEEQTKPLVGYMYYQNAVNNANAVMDFTRFNDNEVTPNTPIISAPQYAYDVFSVQGEGTGGTIRAYRNDMGYVRDNVTRSQDKSISGGADVGIPGHYGANFNVIKTPTAISEWNRGNKLKNTIGFAASNQLEENVYFRNPGEMTVLTNNQFNRIGGTDLVRFKLGGTDAVPTIEPFLEQFSKTSNGTVTATPDVRIVPAYERKKRTQVISFLTAQEAEIIGVDKIKDLGGRDEIRSYRPGVLDDQNNLVYDHFNRYYTSNPGDADTWRRAHHISQVNVIEANGRRYVYGIPVYNVTQKDFTFSVKGTPSPDDQISFAGGDHDTKTSSLLRDKTVDGFVQITTTPAYAHSFLLTALLSPDYVDVTGNGITEDDLGDAVKFNYTRYVDHQWRTPLTNQSDVANFNYGNRSETKDDKGIVSWGKRESWYLHSIESKTMIALFTLEDRKDGKGVSGEQSAVSVDDYSQKRLKKIDLYSKSDLKKNGLAGAKAIKTVWFAYSYRLCGNTISNNGQSELVNDIDANTGKGKLTLDGIYFTFNGKNRTNKNKYVFSYTNTDGTGNPDYALNVSDRWGNYKPAGDNPILSSGILKNADYPYAVQNKNAADKNAGAWSLKKILLPSGGQIEVEYESDDYAFVQNRRATTMMRVLGLGKDPNTITSNLYRYENGWTDNLYAFIEVPDASADIQKTYLDGFDQLAFKLAVNMPKGLEYINCYANVDSYGKSNARNDNKTIWMKLKPARDGMSPLTLCVLDYLREKLPGQAFRGYDVSESTGLKQIADILGGMGDALKSAFKNPIDFLRSQQKAKTIISERSFVRLTEPTGHKYGGGQRVKSVVLNDNWQAMTGQYTSKYGQQYDYTTIEIFNGAERTISSGVASYEPSIGGEENPFFSIVQVADKVPLGPASYGAIEMPVLDAFFPAPVVGYSKVTVRSIQKGTIDPSKKSRSGIGKQVTEFYTAKDFPVYYNQTSFDPTSDKTYHKASVLGFFYKYAIDTRALSQGFIVETNDMHGKLKSQASYAEGDEKTRINYTENFYRNTGANGLNEKFNFVYASKGGQVEEGNMGIDVELMTDTREFSVKSTSFEVQGQLDLFPIFAGLPWLAFIWPVSGNSENTYRAVTTTKVINYHGILDRVVVIDKGSMVTTKNMVYDAETGDVVVNSTQNEFDKPIYSVNYPAYWAYSGMGPAYKNIDAVYSGVNFSDGKITGGMTSQQIKESFESGDELYILGKTPSTPPQTTTTLNATVSVNCDDHNCTQQGGISITFTFPNPTPGNLTIQVGQIVHAVNVNEYWGSGYSIYDLPQGVIPYPYYNTQPSQTFNFSIPQGTTSITFPQPIYIGGVVSNSTSWICHNCQTPITALYIKGYSSDNQYQTNFTTSQNYTVNNILVSTNTVNCILPESNEKLIWAFDKNKNTGSLSDVNPDYVFIDQKGKPYTCSGVRFRIVRSGKRNMLQAPAAAITLMTDPVDPATHKLSYSSLSKVINASAVEYQEKWKVDNDVIRKYRTVTDPNTCEVTEVEDCNGNLEKGINPYRKGLLGNFRVQRNMVFYGDRTELSPAIATNLPQNGFLSGFSPYWNFNTDNNLIPDINNTKWVWNAQTTQFNSKGMELETKDALNIYTVAQYGFNKSLPVAITNNARHNEMFYEGFEDKDYIETLNGAVVNPCLEKHIDFNGLNNSSILSAESMGFNAHSGKNVMQVNNGITTKTLNTSPLNADDFPLSFTTETTTHLANPGGNFTGDFSGTNIGYFQNTFDLPNGGGSNGLYMNTDLIFTNQGLSYYDAEFSTTQYATVPAQGTFYFQMRYDPPLTNAYTSADYTFTLEILDLNNVILASRTISNSLVTPGNGIEIFLCPGNYLIRTSGSETVHCNGSPSNTNARFGYDVEVGGLIGYKNLSTENGCTYTKPIPASENMINPTFILQPGKKMLFNAWVKQNCGTNTCTNKVAIDFGNGNSANTDFNPSGPVIEGWQRIEGEFTTPQNMSSATLKFINNSNQPIYFDDIRIHAFNANMKSYVYDPVSLRLVAELDANNYATFYEYDEEGSLARTKVETKQGIKTVTETRSFKQASINQLQ